MVALADLLSEDWSVSGAAHQKLVGEGVCRGDPRREAGLYPRATHFVSSKMVRENFQMRPCRAAAVFGARELDSGGVCVEKMGYTARKKRRVREQSRVVQFPV